jgi:alpha-amylase/alpha-mannosidase (GH57 family)
MPEGMWLAETAVDIETLEVLAEQGIRFTILAPRQASRIKGIEESEWLDAHDEKIDPRRAYVCHLPSGKSINIFFYDGAIAQDLAFGDMLTNGENFANRLLNAFDKGEENSQLVNIATDGETYGHHHTHGDMALAYCIHHIKNNDFAKITVYGEFLEKFPPD